MEIEDERNTVRGKPNCLIVDYFRRNSRKSLK